jgi:hypothetical protein
MARSLTDSAGVTDTATAGILGGQWTIAVTDTGGLTDSVGLARGWGRVVDDPAGVTDALALLGVWLRALTDSAGMVDALTLAVALALTDSAGVTDDLHLVTFTGKALSDRRDIGRTVRPLGSTARAGTGRTPGF